MKKQIKNKKKFIAFSLIILPTIIIPPLLLTSCNPFKAKSNGPKWADPSEVAEEKKDKNWAYYKQKRNLDELSKEQIKLNLNEYKANYTKILQIDNEFTENSDFVRLFSKEPGAFTQLSWKYYNPVVENQADSSWNTFRNNSSKIDIATTLIFSHDIYIERDTRINNTKFTNGLSKYENIFTLHYAYQKLWDLEYGTDIKEDINKYTLDSNINITDLQNNLINWITQYYTLTTPYVEEQQKSEIESYKTNNTALILRSDLLSNDPILEWMNAIFTWLPENDPEDIKFADFSPDKEWNAMDGLYWNINVINDVVDKYSQRTVNMNRAFEVRWCTKINDWRLYWKPGYYPKRLNSQGKEEDLPNRGITWFGTNDK